MYLRFALLAAAITLLGQDAPRMRVSVTLVQVDAVVTGRDGRQVADLSKDDFELFEDGKPREITHFSYVRAGSSTKPDDPRTPGAAIPAPLTRQSVRRTVALLVDDLKMSFDSVYRAREAVTRFVDRQMEPGDLVAVITTSRGLGALAQFTTDKRLLHAALERIRFRLSAGGAISSVQAIGSESEDGPGEIGQLTRRRFAVGTLAAVRYVAEGMRDLPGRKSLVLISDGLSMRETPKRPPIVAVAQMRRVTDGANRAAVVIYTVDARALWVPGLQAQDNVQGIDPGDVAAVLESRKMHLSDNQVGLEFLADETGGLAHLNSNDFNAGFARVLEDQSGYYLLGFQPSEAEAARMSREGKYHRLTVRVKRPGLTVRYRKGYASETAPEAKELQAPGERLLAGLNSPFASAGLRLRLTPAFDLGEKMRPEVRVLLHIEGSGVSFGPAGDNGLRTARLRMLLAVEGDEPEAVATSGHTYAIRVKAGDVERMQSGGFVYILAHDVRRAGPYQVRVAVLDELSGSVGSASGFVEVPDLSKGKLTISSVMMADGDPRSRPRKSQDSEPDLSPAIRTFGYDHPFSWGVSVYNARLDTRTQQPAVDLRVRILRGDRVVWEGRPVPVVLQEGTDPRRIPAGGVLTLGRRTAAGEYFLEVQAVERNGHTTPAQWIGFEIR